MTNIQKRELKVAGATIEITIGAGPAEVAPVIGAAHPADAFGEATVELLREASGAAVACVNPRGLGGSTPVGADERYALEAMVDDIEGARRAAGLGRWLFWGMSGGGWLALLYARRHPDALAGLIVESACPCFRARLADPACILSPFNPAWRPALAARGLVAADSHARIGDPHATEWMQLDGVGAVFRRAGGQALLVSPAPVSAEMRRAMPELWSFDARAWLSTLRVPTLVLAGDADPVVPLGHARAVHEAIAGSSFVTVEGAGHVPTAQQRPEVAAAVRDFVARLPR